MLPPIIIFAVSGLGIIFIVSVKIYQQAKKITLPFITQREVLEGVAVKIVDVVCKYARQSRQKFHPVFLERIGMAVFAAFHEAIKDIKVTFTAPGHWFDRRTRNLVSLVRGRQNLSGRGAPSSYLRDINHH